MIPIKELLRMNKNYAIPTAQDFKAVGEGLLKNYGQSIDIVDEGLREELYTFPNMDIDGYIAKCIKARQTAFGRILKKYKALQWLAEQQGFKEALDDTLNSYLNKITEESVKQQFTLDVRKYYELSQDQSNNVALEMDIYQLQQKYKEQNITFEPCSINQGLHGDYADFMNHFKDKALFELLSDLCIFYENWINGLYNRKAEYIKSGLSDLRKSLEKIHLIIGKPDFKDCFPDDLLLNVLPLPDIKQGCIKQNSIEYLDEHIKQYKKIGLRQDEHLERRLKIYDLAEMIMKFYPKSELTRTKLDHIIYKLMTTVPVLSINSTEEKLTEKSIRDLLSTKNLNIILKNDIKHASSYPESYAEYDNYMKKYVESFDSYENYLREYVRDNFDMYLDGYIEDNEEQIFEKIVDIELNKQSNKNN